MRSYLHLLCSFHAGESGYSLLIAASWSALIVTRRWEIVRHRSATPGCSKSSRMLFRLGDRPSRNTAIFYEEEESVSALAIRLSGASISTGLR
jgi:hypothetical protein